MRFSPHSVARISMSLLSRDVFVLLVKILSGAAIARLLGPEIFGLWLILELLPLYVGMFGRPRGDAIYYLGAGEIRFAEAAFQMHVVAAVSGTALCVLGIWQVDAIQAYLFPHDPVHRWLLFGVLASLPLSFVSRNFNQLLIFFEDARRYNRFIILQELTTPLMAIILMLGLGWQLAALVAGRLFAECVSIAYGLTVTTRAEGLTPSCDLRTLRKIYGYGLNSYFVQLITQLTTYLPGLVVVRFLSPAVTGFFRLGQDTTLHLNRIPRALSTILYPRISKLHESPDAAKQLTERACRVSVVLLCGVGLTAAALIYPLVLFLYGAEFLPMTAVFWIVLPGVVLVGITEPISQFLFGTGRARALVGFMMAPLAIQVVLSMAAIPRWGAVGAAVSTLVTLMAVAGVRTVAYVRITGHSSARLWLPGWHDLRTVTDLVRDTVGAAASPPLDSRH